MRRSRRALARAGGLFAAAALLTVSGCAHFVGRADRALRATPGAATLHFADPATPNVPGSTSYLHCLSSPESRCDAPKPKEPVAGPVDLRGFRAAGESDALGDCRIDEVARGHEILRSFAMGHQGTSPPPDPSLDATGALAFRGLAAGLARLPELRQEESTRLSKDARVFPGSRAAGEVLSGEVTARLRDFYSTIVGADRKGPAAPRSGAARQRAAASSEQSGGLTLALTSDGARGWAEALHEAAAHEAWEPMYFCGLSRVRDAEERNRPARREAARAVAEAALFLGSYFKAYFRSGQFLDVAIDPKEAETTLVDELKSRLGLGEADARALAKKLLAEISLAPGADGKAHLLTKLSGGFVTRGGNTLAFPGMDVTITPFASSPVAVSRIDLSAVGADVVRVFIEAVGDSLSGVPGVLQSTGCSTRDPSAEPLLACFDPTGTVSADAFAAIDARANSVDGMVGHAVGSAVRGASWFSLNNEALAKVIETAAAAVARKATEKVAWCYQACKDSAARDGLRGVPWEQELTVQLKFRR